MSQTVKSNSGDYHELNAGAHRNSPKNLTAPTLVWHVASWIDAALNEGSRVGEGIKRKIDDHILEVCKRQSKSGRQVTLLPNVSSKVLLFETIVEPENFDVKMDLVNDLLPRERDIFESGMRCVTIKFKLDELDVALRYEIHTELVSMTVFVELAKGKSHPPFSGNDQFDSMIAEMLDCLQGSEMTEAHGRTSEYFFSSFWKNFQSDILGPIEHSLFGKIFADFRGIIFSEKAVKFAELNYLDQKSQPEWGREAKKRFLPLLKTHSSARLREYESAVNYFLDGRALYLSTLAPQLPDASISERIPVRYIIFVHNVDESGRTVVNKRQLGRLINLLHNLGMARLAALRDIKDLREVGQNLSHLDRGLQKAREAIATDDEDATAMKNIKEAHAQFNAISKKFVESFGYGILYRIERSRYYVNQFRKGKKSLRIIRLEGDQPYDKFVERRLGSQYDFIDRVGIRYERAARNVSTLDQNYLSIKTAKLGEEAANINTEINSIQKWGEFFLFLVLLPYYFTHLVEMIVQEALIPWLAVLTWAIFGIVAFSRFAGRRGFAMAVVIAIIVACIMVKIHKSDIDCSWALKICEPKKR